MRHLNRHVLLGLVLGMLLFGACSSYMASRRPQLPARVWNQQRPTEERDPAREVDLILNYQEAFLDVVLWSISLTFSLGALLVAANWFTNREQHLRDLDQIKTEINNSSLSHHAAMRTATEALEAAQSKAIKGGVEALRRDLIGLELRRMEKDLRFAGTPPPIVTATHMLDAATVSGDFKTVEAMLMQIARLARETDIATLRDTEATVYDSIDNAIDRLLRDTSIHTIALGVRHSVRDVLHGTNK